jgi:hypothetical protein
LAASASRVDGEQDGPCENGAEEGDRRADAQVSKEEVGVDGLMLQRVSVGDFEEGADPVEEAGWECRGAFSGERLLVCLMMS